MKKICVLFPGIGYQFDRSLLYYPAKMAMEYGYEIQRVNYSGFQKNLMGNDEKIKEAALFGFEQAKEILDTIDWDMYDDILFISKSIGTIIAAKTQKEYSISVRHVLYTPFKETFNYSIRDGIAFHGTRDPWVKDNEGLIECSNIEMFIYEDVNHSLEGKHVLDNIELLQDVLKKTEAYVAGESI